MRVYKHRLLSKKEKSDRRFMFGKKWSKAAIALGVDVKPLIINLIKVKHEANP